MKKSLTSFLCLSLMALGGTGFAQSVTGPSSSQSPYLVPFTPGAKVTSILTVGDAVNGYKMVGIPDGLGAFDNGDGTTFTLTMNHELGNTQGINRAHGSKGAFVSKWIINKSDLSVVSGSDLMQNTKLWNETTQSYDTYNTSNPSALAAFARFCSADVPAVSAFYNSATNLGTQARMHMNGEENGNEGRLMAHIITGPEAGNSYELPYLGKFSAENVVANPGTGDKTVVAGLDDATPGQVYFYVGTKTNTGNEIERAGLTNGDLYSVAIPGMLIETDANYPSPNTAFTMINLGNVRAMTGTALNTASINAGVSQFLRPEDGAWDPRHPEDFYFVTTNSFTSPSRLWKLHFSDINDLTLGGTVTVLLNGTEGQKMLDNVAFDHFGNLIMVEDVGNNAHLGKTWSYNVDNNVLTQIFAHDNARFLSGGASFLTQDEEASGVLDMQDILGAGWFITSDQAHYATTTELVEGGQLLAIFNPITECASLTKTVTVNGPTTICNAGSVTLTAGAGSSYLWSNGATTRSITVNQSGSYSAIVSGASGCSVESDTTTVDVKALATIKIKNASGSALAICEGNSIQLEIDGTQDLTGFSYQWSVDGNPISGATTEAYEANATGAYTLTVSGGVGCSKTSVAKNITVKPNPVAGFTAAGPLTFCDGGSVQLNADIVPDYNYTWLRDGLASGTGASRSAKVAGDWAVIATLNGCKDTSATQTVTVNALPASQITTADPLGFCMGDSANLEASPVGAGYSYQWTVDNVNITDATSDTYTALDKGIYKVIVTDNNGCSKNAPGVKVSAYVMPNAAIALLGNTTIGINGSVKFRATTGAGYTWQWYLNGNPIPGATERDYIATEGGDYTVVIVKGICSATSPARTVTQTPYRETSGTTSVPEAAGALSFELVAYPNPVSNAVVVTVKGIEDVKATITVMDMNGKLVATREMNGPSVSIDMESFSAAMYLIKYKDEAGRTGTIRITKQ